MKNIYRHLLDNLLVSLKLDEIEDMKVFDSFHQKIEKKLNIEIRKDLKKSQVFRNEKFNMPKEIKEGQFQVSRQLQHDAICNANWWPYLEHQINQGITYARLGVAFYKWHDVVTLKRNIIRSILFQKNDIEASKVITIMKGMDKFFEIGTRTVADAYFKENKEIQAEKNLLEEKNNTELTLKLQAITGKNEELEQFAYIASHDLQEPLRMVTSFLTLLENKYENQLDDKARQYIHFAVDGAIRMRKIILDLLEYSRVGENDYDIEKIDMNDLLSEIVLLCRTTISEKGAVIEWENLPIINAAKTPFQQVLQNLISNAMKYQMLNVKPRIKVTALETTKSWQFSVSDNGIGINPLFFDKIFVAFQRLHNKTEYSGSGIGLAICKKIVENYKGKIWVESVLGQGSTFNFTISKL